MISSHPKKTVIAIVVLFTIFAGCKEKKEIQPAETLFSLLTNTGVDFRNTINDTADLTIYDSDLIYSGAGVAAGDINNDGLTDIFFTGNQVPSRLYLNQGGLKFKDITTDAGIFSKGWATGVAMADVNGDSYLDIYVCVAGFKKEIDKRNLLFINNGNLTFTEKASEYGIDDNGVSQVGSFFDYDNDGDLDLFVVNQTDDITKTFQIPYYKDPALLDTMNCSKLYENTGDKFINVTRQSKINYMNADGFQASIADVNNDGFLDIYVNNDLMQPDFLFMNNGDKTFTESLNKRMNAVPFFSMGSTFSDFNNDGLMDLIATEMMPPGHLRRKNSMPHPDWEFYDYIIHKTFGSEQHSRNMLHIQNPDGSFSEVGELANVSRTDWSWAALGCDFNNDGRQDLYISTGVKRDVFDQTYMSLAFEGKELHEFKYRHEGKELIKDMPIVLLPDYIYENNGDLSFSERMNEWGITQKTASQGVAYADLDNDGYPELIVSNTDSLAFIYRNNGKDLLGNNFLKVRLAGENKNTFGLGAKVKIYTGGTMQYQQMQNSQGWWSSSEPTLFFGLGKNDAVDSLEVWWLGGKYQKFYKEDANQTLTLHEKDGVPYNKTSEPGKPVLFQAMDNMLSPPFRHKEKDFVDFQRDKLIPKMISREGPGIAVADVNHDGLEDFFIGGASGQAGALYMQQQSGKFNEMLNQPWHSDAEFEDISPLFVDINDDGYHDLYVSSGSNEFEAGSPLLADRIYLSRGGKAFVKADASILPAMNYSKGVVKATDIDKDGDLDLFVGGRVKNQYYPGAPESYLLINESGKLIDKTDEWSSELKKYGMVTDAKFIDLNDDSKQDLVLCGEWLPVSVFINSGNKLENQTAAYGLDKTNGWWNSIVAGDFNNDGRIDIAAGNYGLNTIMKCSEKEPVVCYFDDFDKNGSFEPILCNYRDGILAPHADRDLFTRTLPSFHNKFHTYRAYGELSVTDIFTEDQLNEAKQFHAYHFESTLFLNDGNKFTALPLPNEAQVAPVYGMSATDYDGDGMLDLFVCGNTYSSFYEEGPMAALRGLVLSGDGKGKFSVLKYDKTGISLNKDSKAAGLIYVNMLNAHCLLVANNNDELKLFKLTTPLNLKEGERANSSGYLFNYTSPVKSTQTSMLH